LPTTLLLPLEARIKRKNFAMKQPTNALPARANSQDQRLALLEQLTHASRGANQLRKILATVETADCGVGHPR
jgi:hypothetical protein